MKKGVISIAIACSMILAACANDSAVQTEEGDNSSMTVNEQSVQEGFDDSSEGTSEQTTATDESSNALYESFLKNEAKVYFDSSCDNSDYNDPNGIASAEYTLQEFTEVLKTSYAFGDSSDSSIKINGIQYSYIDCGNDGKKELALSVDISNEGLGEGYSQKFIVAENAGKLAIVYSEDEGLRDSISINEYGVVTKSGEDGFGSDTYGEIFFDSEGNVHYVYSVYAQAGFYNEASGGSVWFNDAEHMIPAGLGIEADNLVFFRFDFNDASGNNTESICSYAKMAEVGELRDYYTWGLDFSDDSIYTDAYPLKQSLDGEGITVKSLKEIDQKIAEKEATDGLTEEIKKGKAVEWQPLEYNF